MVGSIVPLIPHLQSRILIICCWIDWIEIYEYVYALLCIIHDSKILLFQQMNIPMNKKATQGHPPHKIGPQKTSLTYNLLWSTKQPFFLLHEQINSARNKQNQSEPLSSHKIGPKMVTKKSSFSGNKWHSYMHCWKQSKSPSNSTRSSSN